MSAGSAKTQAPPPLVGIGIKVRQLLTGQHIITELVPGSAADNSPLEVGEVIQSVNGTDCSYCSTDHLADLLLGPEGSVVNVLTIARGGRPKSINLERGYPGEPAQPANTQSSRPKASPRQPPPGADAAKVGGGGAPEVRSASPIQTPYGFMRGLPPHPGYMPLPGLYGAMPMAGFPGGMQGMNGGMTGESAPDQAKQQQNKPPSSAQQNKPSSSVWRAPWKAPPKDQRAQKPAQNGQKPAQNGNTAAQAARAGGSGSAPPAFGPGQMGQMGFQQSRTGMQAMGMQAQMQPQMGMEMQQQMQPQMGMGMQMGMEMQPQMQPQMGMGMQFYPMMANPGYNTMVNGNPYLNVGMYNVRN